MKTLSKNERLAIKSLSRDIKANSYIGGEMQFTDITNRDYFVKAYKDDVCYCIT